MPCHLSVSYIDHRQYRTRRITQTPYLARTVTSQVTSAMAQQQNNAHSDNINTNGRDKKSSEPLFGPSIGAVRSGPPWTTCSEKKMVTDDLTPEVVNSWIEKSKEVSFVLISSCELSAFTLSFTKSLSHSIYILAVPTYNYFASSC